jgi:Uma2 family endonuclease
MIVFLIILLIGIKFGSSFRHQRNLLFITLGKTPDVVIELLSDSTRGTDKYHGKIKQVFGS